MSDIRSLLREEFSFFVRKALRERFVGELEDEPYIWLLADKLMEMISGKTRRLLVNLPPRHLKTIICSQIFAAFFLGRFPSKHVMIVALSDRLAAEIAAGLRKIVRSARYKDLFPPTGIVPGRDKLYDFATSAGVCTIGSKITGRGADLLLIDDPADINEAGDEQRLEQINRIFESTLLSRLNNPQKARVLVVMHRLHENDLSGHVLRRGDFDHLCLPVIMTKEIRGRFPIKAGVPLRPQAFPAEQIRMLRRTCPDPPGFEALYGQDPAGESSGGIDPSCFGTHSFSVPEGGIALSVDPGALPGGASYTVIQAWTQCGTRHLLVAQWRAPSDLHDIWSNLRRFYNAYRPSVVLIEQSALGPELIGEARCSKWTNVEAVTPKRRSKGARLRPFLPLIRSGADQLANERPRRLSRRGQIVPKWRDNRPGRRDVDLSSLDHGLRPAADVAPATPNCLPVASFKVQAAAFLEQYWLTDCARRAVGGC